MMTTVTGRQLKQGLQAGRLTETGLQTAATARPQAVGRRRHVSRRLAPSRAGPQTLGLPARLRASPARRRPQFKLMSGSGLQLPGHIQSRTAQAGARPASRLADLVSKARPPEAVGSHSGLLPASRLRERSEGGGSVTDDGRLQQRRWQRRTPPPQPARGGSGGDRRTSEFHPAAAGGASRRRRRRTPLAKGAGGELMRELAGRWFGDVAPRGRRRCEAAAAAATSHPAGEWGRRRACGRRA